MAGSLVLPLLGGFIGFAGYIAAALLLEARDGVSGPRLSYGQQAGLISLPICTMIGAAIGFGVSLSLARRYLFSIVLLLFVWLCGCGIVNSMWNDQIARYGRDPSEVVLYYPPLAFSILALIAAFDYWTRCCYSVAGKRHVTKRCTRAGNSVLKMVSQLPGA